METQGVVEHIEKRVGLLRLLWSEDASGASLPVRLGEFAGPSGLTVFSTLGLSDHVLGTPRGMGLRCELVWITVGSQPPFDPKSVLLDVAELALDTHRAPMRGDVIGPRTAFAEGSILEALYVSIPVVLDDAFAILPTPDGDILFPWLMPISRDEAAYVRTHGADAFEERLNEQDVELLNLWRAPVDLS